MKNADVPIDDVIRSLTASLPGNMKLEPFSIITINALHAESPIPQCFRGFISALHNNNEVLHCHFIQYNIVSFNLLFKLIVTNSFS
jgi:hypothetical protein